MAGITVSRGIVKWFKGRETALAMGSEMALARLGVTTCMIFSPFFAKLGGTIDVSRSVAFGIVLLCIALIMFITYFFMDKKLDAQTGETEEQDDPFKISDIGKILSSLGFWLVALLCVLYYSAIFPFLFQPDMPRCLKQHGAFLYLELLLGILGIEQDETFEPRIHLCRHLAASYDRKKNDDKRSLYAVHCDATCAALRHREYAS